MLKKIIVILVFIVNQNGYSQNSLNEINQYLSSTVTIYLDQNTKSGSGFIIDKGKIVTNLHVIEGAKNGYVVINGTDNKHKIDGYFEFDKLNDLIILSVPTLENLPLKLAYEIPKNGEDVYAIENPIISTNIILEGKFNYLSSTNISGILKTSIRFKQGNSGGALINKKGQVIGIIFSGAISSEEQLNAGYAIDVSFLKKILNNKNTTVKELNITNGAYYYQLQSALKFDLKDYSGALNDINKSIELNPKLFMSYYNRAIYNLKLNDLQDSTNDCNKSLEIIPNFAQAYYIKGLIQMKLKNNKDAIVNLNKSIDIDSDYAQAYNMRGIVKANLNDFKGAIKDLDISIKIEPTNSSFFIGRGGFKFFCSSKIEACEDFKKAKEFGHKDAQKFIDKFCK